MWVVFLVAEVPGERPNVVVPPGAERNPIIRSFVLETNAGLRGDLLGNRIEWGLVDVRAGSDPDGVDDTVNPPRPMVLKAVFCVREDFAGVGVTWHRHNAGCKCR